MVGLAIRSPPTDRIQQETELPAAGSVESVGPVRKGVSAVRPAGRWADQQLMMRRATIGAGLILLWLAGLAAATADDGTAHNGPHNVPGTIRAVDFNDGGPLVAHYAATPGNQGGYSGYRPDTDVDIAIGPGGSYVISSLEGGIISDWLKYTVEVGQAGWYKVDYFARTIAPGFSVGLVTLIDDRPLGDTSQGVPVQDGFADVWSSGLYLGAGRHTLGVLIRSGSIALDRVEISPTVAPPALKSRIVPLEGPSAEVVVADAVVTDPPFLADPTGMRDSTQAFSRRAGRRFADLRRRHRVRAHRQLPDRRNACPSLKAPRFEART